VKEVGDDSTAFGFVCDMLKSRGGEITKQNVSAAGWLGTNFLGYVPDSEIYRIRGFITESRNLGLVGRDEERKNGSSGSLSIEEELKDLSQKSRQKVTMHILPEFSTTTLQCAYCYKDV
jgi:hypothetical protein